MCATLALVGCSDEKDEGPAAPAYRVISFESDENLTDYLGAPVTLGHIDVYSSGAVAYSRDKVFWAKPYANE